MARSSGQKLKLLLLRDYLLQNTDENHGVTVRQMIEHLDRCGVKAERKSLYSDLDALGEGGYGMDILSDNGRYSLASRDFELQEVKLLVDMVQSSNFITKRKTQALIKKLETLVSVHDAKLLERNVYVRNRVKAMNESVIYTVDALHEAIRTNSQIRFRYFEWDREKNRVFRKESRTASPWALCWDDANYYLVAHTPEHGITHFRVDKMTNIRQTGEPRVQTPETRKLDLASYGRQVFGMFNGSLQTVRMRFENRLAGVVIDRFGKDVTIVPDGEAHFICRAEVMVSPLFYGWLASFGGAVKLLSPDSVVEEFREQCATILAQYRKEASE